MSDSREGGSRPVGIDVVLTCRLLSDLGRVAGTPLTSIPCLAAGAYRAMWKTVTQATKLSFFYKAQAVGEAKSPIHPVPVFNRHPRARGNHRPSRSAR